ncbi:hypothetical protein FGIG_06194 [Fasciola gigantica]|uniref:Uncharacterized protein n=1 Tax=Fasciola gigantica TaxID=46835 RepID=A0A504Z576_FASGI|nr:hypothetical protein FGIG_06194 [Fasciola gigantica]
MSPVHQNRISSLLADLAHSSTNFGVSVRLFERLTVGMASCLHTANRNPSAATNSTANANHPSTTSTTGTHNSTTSNSIGATSGPTVFTSISNAHTVGVQTCSSCPLRITGIEVAVNSLQCADNHWTDFDKAEDSHPFDKFRFNNFPSYRSVH